METPKDSNAPANLDATPVESLPEKPVTDETAEDVKGGIGVRRAQMGEIDAQNSIRER